MPQALPSLRESEDASAGDSRTSSATLCEMPSLTPATSVYEMQAFLVELLSNFEFALTEDLKRLRREQCGIMAPILEGGARSAALPVRVSLIDHEA